MAMKVIHVLNHTLGLIRPNAVQCRWPPRPPWKAGGPPEFSARKHRKGSWSRIDLSVALLMHSTQPAADIRTETPGVGCVELAKLNRRPSTSSNQQQRPGLPHRFIYEGCLIDVAGSPFLAYPYPDSACVCRVKTGTDSSKVVIMQNKVQTVQYREHNGQEQSYGHRNRRSRL